MNQPSASLHVGDRIVTRHMQDALSPGQSGTIVRIFGTAPGFYDVHIDTINACHVIHINDLEPLREIALGPAGTHACDASQASAGIATLPPATRQAALSGGWYSQAV
jgi:hypothetical protein